MCVWEWGAGAAAGREGVWKGGFTEVRSIFLHPVIHSVLYIFWPCVIIEIIPGFLKIYMRGSLMRP